MLLRLKELLIAVRYKVRGVFYRSSRNTIQYLDAVARAISAVEGEQRLKYELVKSYEVLADKYNDGELAIRDLERKYRHLQQQIRNLETNYSELKGYLGD